MTDPTPTAQPYGGAVAPKTNVLAIVSLVTSILGISLVGIICGHIALNQIRKNGETGRGLAIAGLVLGYIGLVVGLILLIIWIGIAVSLVNNSGVSY